MWTRTYNGGPILAKKLRFNERWKGSYSLDCKTGRIHGDTSSNWALPLLNWSRIFSGTGRTQEKVRNNFKNIEICKVCMNLPLENVESIAGYFRFFLRAQGTNERLKKWDKERKNERARLCFQEIYVKCSLLKINVCYSILTYLHYP